MVEFGQHPLVYQLLNGVPVGIAEASSIIVSSVSANTYQGLTGTISFTGVVQIGDATSVGTSLIDNTTPNYPLIKPLAANTDNFVGFSPVCGTVEIGWAGSPLSVSRGGTNATTDANARANLGLSIGTHVQAQNANLQALADLPGGLADKKILVGGTSNSLTSIDAPTTDNTFLKYTTAGGFSWGAGGSVSYPNFPGRIPYIADITTLASQPWLNIETGTGRFNVCEVYGSVSIIVGHTDTTVTRLSAGDLRIGTNRIFRVGGDDIPVADGGTGKSSFFADQVIFGDDFSQDSAFTFDKTNKILKSTTVCATTVCATTFSEGGTSLASKYLTQADAVTNYVNKSTTGSFALTASLGDLAYLDSVNLTGTEIVGTLPILNGGTGKTTFNADQLIYGNNFAQNSNLTFDGTTTTLKSPTVCATTVCATTIQEGGQSLSTKYQGFDSFLTTLATNDTVRLNADVCNTLPVANGGTGKVSYTGNTILYSNSDGNAINELSPPGTPSYLKWNGSVYAWDNPTGTGGGSPGGESNNVQINYAGSFSGNDGLKYNLNTSTLTGSTFSATVVSAGTLHVGGSDGYIVNRNGAIWISATDTVRVIPSLSAASWLGLPSGLDASSLKGYPIVSGYTTGLNPTAGEYLMFGGDGWYYNTPQSVPGGQANQIQFNYFGNTLSGESSLNWDYANKQLSATNIRSNSLSATSVSANAVYPFTTPRRNFIYYGNPLSVSQGQMTVASSLWFSANATIDGTTSATLFTQRIAVAGARSGTTGGAGTSLIFGRYVANPAVGPSVDPTTEDPPTFIAATGTVNGLLFINASGGMQSTDNTFLTTVNNFNDTLNLYRLSATENIYAETLNVVDAVVANGIESGSISATEYLNLPSATLAWKEAQDIVLYVKNKNATNSIPKGTPVAIVSAVGDTPIVEPLSSVNYHVPEAIGFSNHVAGLTKETIPADGSGFIIIEGLLTGVNTSNFAVGDWLYVSSNGQLNNVRPPAPYESHPVGVVVRYHPSNNGSILVKIENVPELNDIVGFNLASSLVNGDLIAYDLTTSTFVNRQSIDVSGLIKGGSLSATNLSATNARITSLSATTVSATTYRNLPQTDASSIGGTKVTIFPLPPSNNDILTYDNSVSAWINSSTARLSSLTATTVSSTNLSSTNSVINSLSATTVSATNYLNLPNVSALNGTGVFEVTSYSRNNFVLTGTNLALSNTVSNHIVSAVHWDLSTLNSNYINASGDSVTGPFFFGTLSATTFSATTYLNLPSGVATWNANALRGFTVSSTTPTNNRVLTYVSSLSAWDPRPLPAEIGIACSDETTNLTSGTAKATFRMPYAMTLTSVRANVNTAPVGSTILVDVNKNTSSIFSTRVSIDASEKTSVTAATPFVLSITSLADDDEITIDIDQVGSSTAGKGLKIWLIGTRA